MYLLDTPLIAELHQGASISPSVKAWLASVDQDKLCISSLSVAELLDKNDDHLTTWVNHYLLKQFKLVEFNAKALAAYLQLGYTTRKEMLVAIARANALVFTSNEERDDTLFVNPWEFEE